jgi:hypothetical protein
MDIVEYLSKTTNMYFGKVKEGYNYVNKNVKTWESITFYYLIVLISMLVSTLTDVTIYQTIDTNIAILILIIIILSMVLYGLGILIGYGLIHLFLKLFGGTGTYQETIKFAISASIFSAIIGTIVSAITNLLMASTTNIVLTVTFTIILSLISIGIGIWTIIIVTKTLSLTHNLATLKTFLAIIMPALILLGIAFIIGLLIAFFFSLSTF